MIVVCVRRLAASLPAPDPKFAVSERAVVCRPGMKTLRLSGGDPPPAGRSAPTTPRTTRRNAGLSPRATPRTSWHRRSGRHHTGTARHAPRGQPGTCPRRKGQSARVAKATPCAGGRTRAGTSLRDGKHHRSEAHITSATRRQEDDPKPGPTLAPRQPTAPTP